jgi:hypothetical protein
MLYLELFRGSQNWQTIGRLAPGERPGSISHNAPDGRQIYRFEARSSALSVIERSVGGADIEVGSLRAIDPLYGFEEVARLTAVNPTLEFALRTDNMPHAVPFRFRHARS